MKIKRKNVIGYTLKKGIVVILFYALAGCSGLSSTDKEFKKVLNKHVNLGYLLNVYHQGNTYSFDSIRNNIQYLSLVYLEDGCSSCYPKFKEWHDQLQNFSYPDHYGILFIIKSNSLYEFLTKVPEIDLNGNFYIYIDNSNAFLDINGSLPRWAIDHSILIDTNNKIRMIGSPWINKEMKELLFAICK